MRLGTSPSRCCRGTAKGPSRFTHRTPMPFTYFAHQVLVIPLKMARPRWFDGTALCVGSMAPDFAYALSGTHLEFASHTIVAQLLWSVPITWCMTQLFRTRIAAPLGAQLPGVLGAE